jgi:pimeloyl-ACP methyl ester carboxylesterase
MSLLKPDFVAEEERMTAEYEKKHPDLQGTVPFEKRSVHYVTAGTKGHPKIIFVHGSPGDWGAFVRQLNDPTFYAGAYLISGDRLGYGGSDPGHTERSLDEQAKAMMTLLDVDDPHQPVILVGHSYGGPVVARMAMTGDPRIRAVLILAGSVDPSLEPYSWYQTPADWVVFRWMLPTILVTCNQEIIALKPELVRVTPLWSHITAKFTVIQGLKDDMVAPGNADFIEKKLARLKPKIIRVENLNHFIPSDRPDLIREALADDLKELGVKQVSSN